MKRKRIRLTVKERAEIEQFCAKGVHSVRLVNRAKIILALDQCGGRIAAKQMELAERIGVCRQTVVEARDAFLELKSVKLFLQRKKRGAPPVPPKVNGELEARIIALACGKAPEGYVRWTLRLLADKCVGLQYSDTMSHMTIRRLLRKTNLSLT